MRIRRPPTDPAGTWAAEGCARAADALLTKCGAVRRQWTCKGGAWTGSSTKSRASRAARSRTRRFAGSCLPSPPRTALGSLCPFGSQSPAAVKHRSRPAASNPWHTVPHSHPRTMLLPALLPRAVRLTREGGGGLQAPGEAVGGRADLLHHRRGPLRSHLLTLPRPPARHAAVHWGQAAAPPTLLAAPPLSVQYPVLGLRVDVAHREWRPARERAAARRAAILPVVRRLLWR
jgi:hypothetical protein